VAEPSPISGCRLLAELQFYGCDMDPSSFNDTLTELHLSMNPQLNPEQLLYRPYDGLRFCAAVRARTRDSLPDEMILRRLRNIQKAGRFTGPTEVFP
jgi:hypothetical protein